MSIIVKPRCSWNHKFLCIFSYPYRLMKPWARSAHSVIYREMHKNEDSTPPVKDSGLLPVNATWHKILPATILRDLDCGASQKSNATWHRILPATVSRDLDCGACQNSHATSHKVLPATVSRDLDCGPRQKVWCDVAQDPFRIDLTRSRL